MPTSAAEVVGGLALLFLVSLPLGAVLIRAGERFLGHRINLAVPERIIVAFYATGGLFFVTASLPFPIYNPPLILGLLVAGLAGYGVLAMREAGSGLRSVLKFFKTSAGLVLLFGTLGLLVLEVVPTWTILLPNMWDGSATSLWMNLTLANHTLPSTLGPFASSGVVYPLGTTVWMTLPAVLLGWPIVSCPLLLPPLFLCLSFPAAYCWGARLGGYPTTNGRSVGLLFAGFFGLVASWPRLFVGGSYDFAFALPMLMVALGWMRPLVARLTESWREVVALGVMAGTMTVLSPVSSEAFILILLGSVVTSGSFNPRLFGTWLARLAAITAIAATFVVRTFFGFAMWFSYPNHVLTDAGNPPYASPLNLYPFSARLVVGELDPFVPWKGKISPFPYMTIELQALLAVGLVLLALCYVAPKSGIRELLPRGLTHPVAVGMSATFLMTLFLTMATVPGSPVTWMSSTFSSLGESSVLLFLFFEVVAMLPVIAALSLLADRGFRFTAVLVQGRPSSEVQPPEHAPAGVHRSRAATWPKVVALGLVIVIPLGTGTFATLADVPGFLHSSVLVTSNVTRADLDALEWVGNHLPACSRVLVAPGSVGQYLPEYAKVGVVFPMNPPSLNLSYNNVVSDLTSGVYDNSTRDNLAQLSVTDVFVSGQTSASYLPFQLRPLTMSTDFHVLLEGGDAAVLSFVPGILSSGCGE